MAKITALVAMLVSKPILASDGFAAELLGFD
jgi:hypothetical protein